MRDSRISHQPGVTRADLWQLVYRYGGRPFAEAMRRALQRQAAQR